MFDGILNNQTVSVSCANSGTLNHFFKKKNVSLFCLIVEWVNSDDSNNRCMRCANVPGTTDSLTVETNQGRCDTCLADGTKCLTCLVGYLRSDEKG